MSDASEGYTFLDVRAGAGGMAAGFRNAGFMPVQLVEDDHDARRTLELNGLTPVLNKIDEEQLAANLGGRRLDVLLGSLSSSGITVASAANNDSALVQYSHTLQTIDRLRPRAVLLVNVSSLLQARFEPTRSMFGAHLDKMNYQYAWQLVNCAEFGLPQARIRSALIAFDSEHFTTFAWPGKIEAGQSVGERLYHDMSSRGWLGAEQWSRLARGPAPTIVGGSKRHGGADLGPTRTKRIWHSLGVDPRGIADLPPDGSMPVRFMPKLTNAMLAKLQGFPEGWQFYGGKTTVYRQIAGAFPASVAELIALEVAKSLQ